MNKNLKTGILIAILGIPVLAFIFLKLFGRNTFDLPYFFPQLDDSGEVVMSKGDTLFTTAPSFRLLDTKGDSVQVDTGTVRVVNFFFSRCGTICPVANSLMAQVADNFKDNAMVQFYGLSVDPKYDTPEVLHTYSRALGLDGVNYHLLTGDKKYIYDLSIQGYHLPVADASEYDASITDIENGFFRGIYSGTKKAEMDRLKVEIKVLLSQDEK
jgi:protein SCO1/2